MSTFKIIVGHIFLVLLGIGVGYCIYGMISQERSYKLPHRKTPIVQLQTEERINKGDTLYVSQVDKDTIYLWGK